MAKGFNGGGMPGGLNNIMKQAQKMQRQMEEAKKLIEEQSFDVSSGGGAVKITITGTKEVKSIEIAPELVDPDDIDMLQDTLVAAVNEAIRKVEEFSEAKMSGLTGGLDIPGLF
ncbi:nucleoid-associated protein [Clostridia bacterium]|nr:nucleoid-associated protein [Clostridia bacterium]